MFSSIAEVLHLPFPQLYCPIIQCKMHLTLKSKCTISHISVCLCSRLQNIVISPLISVHPSTSMARSSSRGRLLLYSFVFLNFSLAFGTDVLRRGFSLSPDLSSPAQFQPVLTDATSTFSLGFLRVDSDRLDVAVLHLPSSFPLWRAVPHQLASWSVSTSLSFDGSLVLSDARSSVSWSTARNNGGQLGDSLVLLNSSNLQIIRRDADDERHGDRILWQSFDFPSDTVVGDQNFTSLLSADGRFSMSLGPTYMALYLEPAAGGGGARAMYRKHTALQVKARIVDGQGPIYARVDPTGFLGMYQTEAVPADVVSFDTFNGGARRSLRRLTLEADGNLRAYYWSGSAWVSDYVEIADTCGLPAACGPYGLCHVDGQRCGGTVDNRTDTAGPTAAEDLCGSGGGYLVARRAGVDLVNSELLGSLKVNSLGDCEALCERNCSCWGAVYNNASGHCLRINYPIQTLLAVGDEKRVGYFKVSNNAEESRKRRRSTVQLALVVVAALLLAGGSGYAGYRVWRKRRQWRCWRSGEEEEVGLPYKDLNSSSFRSIEMSGGNSFRK